MRRREFIAGLILTPLVTRSSSAAEKHISILHSGFPERTPIHVLIEALRALGHENGTTAVIEVLGGEGDAGRLGTLVNGIAASKPDVTRRRPSAGAQALIFNTDNQMFGWRKEIAALADRVLKGTLRACRSRNQRSFPWASTSRPQRHSGLRSRQCYSRAPTSSSNKDVR